MLTTGTIAKLKAIAEKKFKPLIGRKLVRDGIEYAITDYSLSGQLFIARTDGKETEPLAFIWSDEITDYVI